MEKQAKYQDNKILKFLPRAVSVVHFHQGLAFSPNRDKRFSGPIMSIIPHEARRKPKKNGGREDEDEDEDEPTSPKVSCIGQIKHKHKKIINDHKKKKRPVSTPIKDSKPVAWSPREVKKHALAIKRMFSIAIKPGRKSDVSSVDDDHHDHDHDHHLHKVNNPGLPDRAPCLSQMRRFASGREHSLSNFDWTVQDLATPVDADHRNMNCSDEEDGEESDQDEEILIPFSAPIIVGREVPNLQPRKEINLWKRRTMTPPRPLELNPMMIRAN